MTKKAVTKKASTKKPIPKRATSKRELLSQVEELRGRLEEAEEALRAIRAGEVDALVVSQPEGEAVFTLKGAERPYRVMVETMNEGALTLSDDGTILYCNTRFAELVQTPLERVIGCLLAEFVMPDNLPKLQALLQAPGSKAELALAASDRAQVPTHFSTRPFRADDVQGTCVVVTDLTEIAAANEALRRAHAELEVRVRERTVELREANERLREQAEELQVASEELAIHNNELRVAQVEAVEERQRYQELFDFAPGGYLVTDPRGVIREANRAAAAMLGMGIDWLIGKPLWVFVAIEEHSAFYAHLAQLQNGQETWQWEMRLQPREDVSLPVLVDVAPIRDTPGKLVGFRWLLRDITERKNAEQALRESEAKANALIKYAPTGIYEIDYRGPRFISVNEAMCQILGYTREELFSMSPSGLLDEPSRALFAERIRRQLTGQKIDESVEYRVQKKDGSFIDAVLNVTLNIAGDEPSRALVVAHDVTERKRVEKALRESEARFRLALKNAPVSVAAQDRDLRFLWAYNQRTVDPSAVIGKTDTDVFPPEDAARLMALKRRCLETETELREQLWLTSGGRRVFLDLYLEPMRDASGQVTGVGIATVDLTQVKLAEEELHQLNRTLTARSHSDQALMRATDEAEYMQQVCQIIVQDCGHAMVWIGFAEEDEAKSVRPVAYAGFEEGYLETLHITWADTERGRGPTGTAVRTGQVSMCRNMLTDPQFLPWREQALRRGYAASIVLPMLADDGKVFGALTIYSREPDPFSDDEIQLLTELTNDCAHGVNVLRLRAAHARAEQAVRESEERLNRSQEIAHLGSWELDLRNNTLSWSNEVYRIFGLQPQEFGATYEAFLEAVHPDDRAAVDDAYSGSLREGRDTYEIEHRVVRKSNGEVRIVHEKCDHIRGGAGQLIRSVGMVHDITERKQAEAERERLLAHTQEQAEQLRTANEQLREQAEELEVASEELAAQNDELRAARQTVEAERQRYQELFELAPGGYLVTDQNGTIREANRAAAEMLNVRADRLEGKPLTVFVNEQEQQAFSAQLTLLQQAQETHQWEMRLQPRESAPMPALVDASPTRDAQGRVSGFRWLLRDITEREQAEQERERLLAQVQQERERAEMLAQALKIERDTLDTIMENTRTQLAYLDPRMNFVRVNSAYTQGSGHTKEELLGRNHFELFPNAENEAIFERARDTGQAVEFRAKPFEYADQPWRGVTYWDWTLVPVKNASGQVQGLVFSLADVTENVRAAQERERLLEENRRQRILLETLFEADPDGVAVVTGEGLVFQLANPAYQAFTPRPTENPVGQSWAQVWAGSVTPDALSAVRRVLATGEQVDEESQPRFYPDGQTRYFSFHARRLPWGAEDAVLMVLQEITEIERARFQAAESAQEAQRRADERDAVFAAMTDAVIVYDADGVSVQANPAAVAAYGFDPTQSDRTLITRLLSTRHTDGRPVHVDDLPSTRALRGETVRGERLVFTNLDKRNFVVLSSASPLFVSGRVSGAVAVWHDITELERVEEELRASRDELELRVAERTVELTQANAALQTEIIEHQQTGEALREREAQYRGIFEATSDGLIICGPNGSIVETNPAACRMYGYTCDEFIGLEAVSLMHPDSREALQAFVQSTLDGAGFQAQMMGLRKDGSSFHVEKRGVAVMYRGQPHTLVVARDITERVRAYQLLEQRVEERTRELSTLLAISHNMASTLELGSLLSLILDQLKQMVDYTGAALLMLEGEYLTVAEYRGSAVRDEVLSTRFPVAQAVGWKDVIDRREPVLIPDLEGDSGLARAFRESAFKDQKRFMDGARSWVGIPLIVKDQVIGVLRLSHMEPDNFTARHAQLALAIANQAAVAIENARLYEQAQQLAAVEERQRLARELHDSVSQAFYGISLGVHTAIVMRDRNPDKVTEALNYVLSLADAGLTEMRALIFELRPDSLEMEGLTAALAKQSAALRARHGIEVDGNLCEEPDVPLKTKEALYRIAQEALTNAVKHAQATRLGLRLSHDKESIVLEVSDDGLGFDPTGSYPGHLGLRSMRERAARLGGVLNVESAPGQGTRIRARFPI